MKILFQDDFIPVAKIKNKNIECKYYDDSSGYLVVTDNEDRQIFCEESGSIHYHLAQLKRMVKYYTKAIAVLEKILERKF